MSRSLTHSPVSSPCQPSATAVLLDREPISTNAPLYQAVGDHTPSHDGELTLSDGDIISSVRQLGNGWALGRNDSAPDRPAGIFPVACVIAISGPRPGDNFVECRRCGGSLPISRIQPSERPVPANRLSAPWDRGGPAVADVAPRTEDCAEIELVPQSLHADPPPQGATPRETADAGDVGESTGGTRVSFPADDAVDTPPSVPRRSAPLPPKPHLVVKPTRDKPAAVNEYTIPTKSAGRTDGDAAARVTSPYRAKPGRRQHDGEEEKDDHSWCGVRSASRRRSRGPPPPPPARTLSTFVGRSDPTLRQTVVASSSPHSVGDPIDSRCGCIDSLGVARRHARTRQCISAVPATMNGSSPSAPDLSFGVPLQPGALRLGRPMFKARTPRVADSVFSRPGSRRPSWSSSSSRLSVWSASCRLIGSMATGILLAVLTFAVFFYDQSCDIYTSLVASFAVAVIAALILCVSRFCRCVVALVPVSLSTARGRVVLCLAAFSVLLAGPVLNVHRNAGEAVRSLTCSAELALNRTASLLRPFDAMMSHLDRTVSRLEGAAADVSEGLKPLDEGLDAVEVDVKNARTQLLGTRRTCKNLIDGAFDACDKGIVKAQDQCLGVMGELGKVYHHARDVLDRINPERWAGARTAPQEHQQQQPGHPGRQKRQLPPGFEGISPRRRSPAPVSDVGGGTDADATALGGLPADSSNICEPLSSSSVCKGLNDSETLCQPARWAGEAIQEAINATRAAMRSLEKALRFRVRSAPYEAARANANSTSAAGDGLSDFDRQTSFFPVLVVILRGLIPCVIVILLFHAAYLYTRLYICGCDSFDNVYVASSFAQLDRRRAEVTGERLLPLKKHEQRHLITAASWRLSRPEYRLYRSGLCVLTLCVATAVTVCSFDYALYWIMSGVDDPATGAVRGRQRREALDGRPSARVHAPPSSIDPHSVVAGDGVVASLLDRFIRGFEPGWMEPASVDEEVRSLGCLPVATTPSLIVIIILAVIYVLFFLTVALKAYVYRARVGIAGYFYAEHEAERTVHLYAVLLRRRHRLPCLLRQLALSGRRRRLAREGGCGMAGRHSWLATVVLRRCVRPRCVVCGCVNDDKFRECPCGGLYCADCFVDVGRCCPLCRHDDAPVCHLDDGYYDDCDEYDDDGSVDDALEAYCASSRVDI